MKNIFDLLNTKKLDSKTKNILLKYSDNLNSTQFNDTLNNISNYLSNSKKLTKFKSIGELYIQVAKRNKTKSV